MRTTVIIGGGAAGMISAVFAAGKGNKAILIEKNEKLGKKIYITGKGRCNLTNDCTEEEFISNVVSNPKFLLSAVKSFPPQKTCDFFESNGLKLKTERGNRVFPFSDKASDVTKTLADAMRERGVDVCLEETVKKIVCRDGKVSCVMTDKREICCDSVIICTGGVSYPSTGSTGDGYLFAASCGHAIVPPRAALSGIETVENYKELQGLSLKNVRISVLDGKKEIFSEIGEMLFTHYGVSGPLILSVSSLINRRDQRNIRLFLDLKPGLSEDQLRNRILRDFAELKGKKVYHSLVKLLPSRLIGAILKRAEIDEKKRNAEFSSEDMKKLLTALKKFEIRIRKLRPIEEAVVTAGGVSVKEINPKTMESKLINGLFFAGEVLDLDAFTGGFNLQIAFMTGYIAGTNA